MRILPTKHLGPDRALLHLGAEVLGMLTEPKSVSRLWDELKRAQTGQRTGVARLSFDWFVLALDLLFAIQAVDDFDGRIGRSGS